MSIRFLVVSIGIRWIPRYLVVEGGQAISEFLVYLLDMQVVMVLVLLGIGLPLANLSHLVYHYTVRAFILQIALIGEVSISLLLQRLSL